MNKATQIRNISNSYPVLPQKSDRRLNLFPWCRSWLQKAFHSFLDRVRALAHEKSYGKVSCAMILKPVSFHGCFSGCFSAKYKSRAKVKQITHLLLKSKGKLPCTQVIPTDWMVCCELLLNNLPVCLYYETSLLLRVNFISAFSFHVEN